MQEKRIIGIDFGTSTSVVRVKNYNVEGEGENEKWSSQERDVTLTRSVTFNNGSVMVPTLVQKGDGKVNYGHDALIKRKGQELYQNFKISLEGENSAEARELTAEFIKYLYSQYKEQRDGGHLGNIEAEERTIISYPVKWSDDTRQFMINSASEAGFRNVYGMDEAKAAITAVVTLSRTMLERENYIRPDEPVNIMLIDMGAGTTDIVISRYTHGSEPKNEILCTWPQGGEILFGGRELDEILRSYICEKVPEEVKPVFTKKIKLNEYKAWKENNVSGSLKNNECVTTYATGDNLLDILGAEMEPFKLDRAEFERISGDYLLKFTHLVNGSISECVRTGAVTGGDDIDLVILTGGHSQWYFVREMLTGKAVGSVPENAIFLKKIIDDPKRIIEISKPQETVALGLAYSKLDVRIVGKDTASAGTAASEPGRETSSGNAFFTPNQVEEEDYNWGDPADYQIFWCNKNDRYISDDTYYLKIEDLKTDSEAFNKALGSVVMKYTASNSTFGLYNASFKPTSNNFRLMNELQITAGETVIFMADTSWFQRGAHGFAMTVNGIHYKPSLGITRIISWSDLIMKKMNFKGTFLYAGSEAIAEGNPAGLSAYLSGMFNFLRSTDIYKELRTAYKNSYLHQTLIHQDIEEALVKTFGEYDGTPCIHPLYSKTLDKKTNYMYVHFKTKNKDGNTLDIFISDAGAYICELFNPTTMHFDFIPFESFGADELAPYAEKINSSEFADFKNITSKVLMDYKYGKTSELSDDVNNYISSRRKFIEKAIELQTSKEGE